MDNLPENQNIQRKLAHIERIDKIHPIEFINKEKQLETASGIVSAEILGWHVVVKKGEYKEGDLCVYVEIDSILPEHPEFAFLGTKRRIKTAKLCGQISQGITFPVSVLKHFMDKEFEIQVGLDVTDIIGVTKYDPQEIDGDTGKASKFPDFFKKTDEERIQNLKWVLEKCKDVPFYVTEKLDGTSISIYYKEGKFGVCSRNLELEDTNNDYYKAAQGLKVEEGLAKLGKNIVLQGELIGPGIQKNKYNLTEKVIRFFNVYDVDKAKYLELVDFEKFIKDLGYETVPIIDRNFTLPKTVDELVLMADGPSVLNKKQTREGLVIRPLTNLTLPNFKRVSFKAISNKFLLKYE